MTRPFARQYAALPSEQGPSRHPRRLSIERLEDIAAANSLQDLLLAGFLGEAGAMAPTQSSIGDNLKSSERLVAAPPPIAALESRPTRPDPTLTESTTTVDPAASNPLLPASVAINLADADLWLIGTSEPASQRLPPATIHPRPTRPVGRAAARRRDSRRRAPQMQARPRSTPRVRPTATPRLHHRAPNRLRRRRPSPHQPTRPLWPPHRQFPRIARRFGPRWATRPFNSMRMATGLKMSSARRPPLDRHKTLRFGMGCSASR